MQLIALFSAQGYRITFATTAVVTEHSDSFKDLSIETRTMTLNDPSFDGLLEELNPDVVLFDRFITEEQFGWRVAEICPDALKVLDTEDLHFLRKARQEAYNKGLATENVYTETAKREIASILRCDLSLIISEVELALLTDTFAVPEGIVYYLPFLLPSEISATTQAAQANFNERSHFMTVGNMKHAPNVASVKLLKRDIWPVLRERLPKAELHIYGAYAPQQLQEMHNPKEGFHIKRWVRDISAVMRSAKVQLAPLPYGAGLKGKLIDAMVNGLPTVTSSAGAEGMFGAFEPPGSIANRWEAVVNEAESLYTRKANWLKAQQNGYDIVATRFQKSNFSAHFNKKIEYLSHNLSEHRQNHFIGQILQHQTLQATKYLSKWIEEKNKKNGGL